MPGKVCAALALKVPPSATAFEKPLSRARICFLAVRLVIDQPPRTAISRCYRTSAVMLSHPSAQMAAVSYIETMVTQ
jgi:hypothetical protein